jgi:GNAT superfamily N-acetyltransferase
MYTALGRERLKNGARMEIGVVRCPDPEWAPRVIPFLGHKRPETREHIRRALDGSLDDLQTLFYVGAVEDEIVTQVMIAGARGAGILGHVYTPPEWRRLGAYSHLMRYQMKDMERSGFQVLCLSTGFETPPYWIYHAHGFRSIGPGRGQMVWRASPDAEAALLSPAAARIRRLRWDDWAWFDLLAMQPVAPGEDLPRCAQLGLKDQGSLESAFVPFILQAEKDGRIQAQVLETDRGATAGFALLGPDRHWFGDTWVADVYVHPQHRRWEPELVASLSFHGRRCATYRVGGNNRGSECAWREAGFHVAASLPEWIEVAGKRRDLEMWVRTGSDAQDSPIRAQNG